MDPIPDSKVQEALPGADRTHVGPMWAMWILLSEIVSNLLFPTKIISNKVNHKVCDKYGLYIRSQSAADVGVW